MKLGTYIGDGIYIEIGNYKGEFILYTSNGIEITNTIILGINELKSINDFVKLVMEHEDK